MYIVILLSTKIFTYIYICIDFYVTCERIQEF